MSVTVAVRPQLSSSAPTRAYDLASLRVAFDQWSVLPDGRLFAIRQSESEYDVNVLNVVLNWRQELERSLPSN